jgi:hypothetical protein
MGATGNEFGNLWLELLLQPSAQYFTYRGHSGRMLVGSYVKAVRSAALCYGTFAGGLGEVTEPPVWSLGLAPNFQIVHTPDSTLIRANSSSKWKIFVEWCPLGYYAVWLL